MSRNKRFTMRMNTTELDALNVLASRRRRSRSDLIRLMIMEAVAQLDERESATERSLINSGIVLAGVET